MSFKGFCFDYFFFYNDWSPSLNLSLLNSFLVDRKIVRISYTYIPIWQILRKENLNTLAIY